MDSFNPINEPLVDTITILTTYLQFIPYKKKSNFNK